MGFVRSFVSCRAPALCLALLLPVGWAGAQEPAVLAGEALVEALRAGGYNIYFRHVATDWSQEDVEQDSDWASCDARRMRQLSASGRETARRIGAAMRALRIPVGRVLASPYCRTVETAALMDLGPVSATADVMNLRVAGHHGGREVIAGRAQALLAAPPAPGTNTVIAAHGNVALEATGVYPGEGEGIVFAPTAGGGFEFVGRITPAQWQALARATAG
jgi:hypothetical protein